MTHLFVLWLALFAAQTTTPATPSPSQPSASQPAPATPTPHAMGMPSFPPHQTTPAILPSLNPDASGIYVVGDGVTPPKVLSQPPPKFSEIARQQKISGIVTLSLIVDKEGNPVNVHVIKSIADTVGVSQREAALTLDQAAVDAVRQYKFSPATKNGVPVAVYLNVNVNFEIF